MNVVQIAIDGPAGAGKSTIAKRLAEQLDFTYIDTGAMYRGITLKAKMLSIPYEDEKRFDFVTKTVFAFDHGKLIMDGKDVSTEIRTNEISNNVSLVSSYHFVREQLVLVQQKMALAQNVVMDGRDIGYHVLPNATHKFFLTASIEERAIRRYYDNKKRGIKSNIEKLKEEIARRDYLDTTREHSPLRPADDAIIIDTSHLSIDQVIATITDKIREV
jgi:cytidylate kinase